MMIKVGDTFLDFNAPIEMEQKIKLMEEIDATDGDFSYTFEVDPTSHNVKTLGNPSPDNINKIVYQRISSTLLNDDGTEVYRGFMRIERITDVIECSFFSGNNNWFALTDFPLQDLPLSEYDQVINKVNIQASWANSSGNYFPLIDSGILSPRKTGDLIVEDFYPFFYIHTLMTKVCGSVGIKLQGSLLSEWRYLRMIVAGNVSQESSIENRSSFALLTSNQGIAEADGPEPIIFNDDFTEPYYDGSENNFNATLGRYTADVPMRINIEADAEFSSTLNSYRIGTIINGGAIYGLSGVTGLGEDKVSLEGDIFLEQGDYVEIYAEVLNTLGTANITSATVKITPLFIYKIQGGEFLPKWTGAQLLGNVFSMFNCLVSYDPSSKTITANLFEKVKSRPTIDLSPYLAGIVETDYTDFISDYGKNTRLSYEESDFTDRYNSLNIVPYAAKDIRVNNEFIESEADGIESEFTASIGYEHAGLGTQVDQFEFYELIDGQDQDITSITDSSGQARLNMASSQPFTAGNIVRVDVEDEEYNGDWIVETIGVGWIELKGMSFTVNSTGTATRMIPTIANNDQAFILLANPSTAISDLTIRTEFTFDLDSVTQIGYAYFNLLNKGRGINRLSQSLSFGPINNPNHYQQDMYQSYFRLFDRVLNDPVKMTYEAYLPAHVHKSIDHQSPTTITSIETSNEYYINKISGYQGGEFACEIELIKLP